MKEDFHKEFEENLRELNYEEIIQLAENEVRINDILVGLANQAYTVSTGEELENGDVTYILFYINSSKGKLTGWRLWLSLSYGTEKSMKYVLLFSKMLSEKFEGVNMITTFNQYQDKIRSILERRGYTTYTGLEFDFVGYEKVELFRFTKGIIKVPLINPVDFIKTFFDDIPEIVDETTEKVYLMYDLSNDLTKIGESKKPKYREGTLHGKQPDVHLLHYWEVPKKVERELHKKYKHKRKRGEWFDLNINEIVEIRDYLDALETA